MSSRAPQAEDTSIVLVGSLNPGIFHPEWFRRQEILLPQEVESAEIKLISPEVTEIHFLDMKLDVFPERFVLETTDSSRAEKLQDIVVNVLTRLPHTPITGCGLNNAVLFDLDDEEYWHKIGHVLAPKESIWDHVLSKPGLSSLTIKGVREGEFPGFINVTVAPSQSTKIRYGLSINSNFHYQLPRTESGIPESERTVRYVQEMWKPALGMARAVADRLFDQIRKGN